MSSADGGAELADDGLGMPEPHWARNLESRLRAQIAAEGEQTRQAVADAATAVLSALDQTAGVLAAAFSADIAAAVASIVNQLQPVPTPTNPGPATGLALSIGGSSMSDVSLSVDAANENIHVDWVDDHGDVTTDIPAGATLSVSSSDSTIVSAGTFVTDAAGSGADAPLTFLKSGAVVLTVTAADSTGATLFTPATVNLTLTPGAASGFTVQVEQETPVAVPAPTPGA